MFTNNYWAALTNMFGPNNSYYRNGVSTIGSDASLSHLRSMQSMKIGTGNTPAKKSDYVLEAPIDESLYTVAFVDNFSSDISSDEAYLSLQATFTNTSNSTLTFSEVGVFASAYTNANVFLIAREVLDSPVSIAPGEAKTFILKVY